LLYLGTEGGLYVSFDDGANWQPLQSNLPHAAVYWIVIQEQFNDLVIATYGRGFWILDDLTPLQQLSQSVRDANAHLFPPRPAYRFRSTTVPVSMEGDPTVGQNPPYGAAINYYLKSVPTADVKIRIENAKGQTVRTLTGTKTVGINRVTWDLQGEQSKEIRLRTSPAYAPEIRVGPEGWRAASGGTRMAVLLPPGTYTVKLSTGGTELSQQLVIKKDPNSEGTEVDIQTQTAMLSDLRKDLETAAEMVNQIEMIRSQLLSLTELLGGDQNAAVKTAADALDKNLTDVEDNLIQRKVTGQAQDTVRWPPKLISKINYLAGGLSGSDFAPTNQQREVQALFETQLAAHRKRLDEILGKDLDNFNKLLRERNIQNIIAR